MADALKYAPPHTIVLSQRVWAELRVFRNLGHTGALLLGTGSVSHPYKHGHPRVGYMPNLIAVSQAV